MNTSDKILREIIETKIPGFLSGDMAKKLKMSESLLVNAIDQINEKFSCFSANKTTTWGNRYYYSFNTRATYKIKNFLTEGGFSLMSEQTVFKLQKQIEFLQTEHESQQIKIEKLAHRVKLLNEKRINYYPLMLTLGTWCMLSYFSGRYLRNK